MSLGPLPEGKGTTGWDGELVADVDRRKSPNAICKCTSTPCRLLAAMLADDCASIGGDNLPRIGATGDRAASCRIGRVQGW
ncbi:hypothetical protein GCM10022204_41650 [Microlunatus aurantiacus]|uniref:Uncharacterized protein n=1 Tax=Microlunatus aurantiacus TaxID=446786 RepID=A0ABP7EHU1_9ACTN